MVTIGAGGVTGGVFFVVSGWFLLLPLLLDESEPLFWQELKIARHNKIDTRTNRIKTCFFTDIKIPVKAPVIKVPKGIPLTLYLIPIFKIS